ncbi:hypothetical protein O3P69_002252 [Scylla paramamosain]|uniref:Uncharacterized protein n=1 Tax=Scylla paramamosain TaxID=85552 RepID=A0AAW0V6N8_SCYPA
MEIINEINDARETDEIVALRNKTVETIGGGHDCYPFASSAYGHDTMLLWTFVTLAERFCQLYNAINNPEEYYRAMVSEESKLSFEGEENFKKLCSRLKSELQIFLYKSDTDKLCRDMFDVILEVETEAVREKEEECSSDDEDYESCGEDDTFLDEEPSLDMNSADAHPPSSSSSLSSFNTDNSKYCDFYENIIKVQEDLKSLPLDWHKLLGNNKHLNLVPNALNTDEYGALFETARFISKCSEVILRFIPFLKSLSIVTATWNSSGGGGDELNTLEYNTDNFIEVFAKNGRYVDIENSSWKI